MSEESLNKLWDSHAAVRDRVVEIDKLVVTHAALHERHARDIQSMNTTISKQFGEIQSTMGRLEKGQHTLNEQESYRKGAVNMLAWGIGLFCTVAAIAVAIWGVVAKFGT